jgi:deazaflavin-dependent oxidoreductase (nitroreductase family)
MDAHYKKPGWMTKHVFNGIVSGLTRMGVSVAGSRVLEVKGRKSGQPRQNPVNLLAFEGEQYLVAPRGEAEWVRNVRADSGRLALLVGHHRDEFVATELADDQKTSVLREYLRRWKAEVGIFFDGVGPNSTDQELAAIAPRHPVFVLHPGVRTPE